LKIFSDKKEANSSDSSLQLPKYSTNIFNEYLDEYFEKIFWMKM